MMLSPRILVSSFGLLLGNLLILNGLVPSNVTLCVLFLTLFCISFFLRVFYKGFIHFWGESFYQIVLVLLLFSSTLIIAYGRIGLNAHLTHCFATVFAAGMVGPANGLITQMMPSGSENYANSGGSWREYLNLSPEQGEGGGNLNQPANQANQPANQANQPANQPVVYEDNTGEPRGSHYWRLREFGFDYVQTMNTPDGGPMPCASRVTRVFEIIAGPRYRSARGLQEILHPVGVDPNNNPVLHQSQRIFADIRARRVRNEDLDRYEFNEGDHL